ncbi:MAG TPA: AraC family transcriptional regulator [Anaerovoracaceae bacterium]|nr:AraC family transcriptional regulator [Anaerovoracaceae bacterium]
MEILLYSNTESEFEAQFLRNLNPMQQAQGPERVCTLPEEKGKGSFCCLPLTGGVKLNWMDMTFRETQDIRSEARFFHSEFNYCIEGSGTIEINGMLFDGPVTSGHVQFMCGSHAVGVVQIPANKRIRQLSMELSPLFWQRMEIDPDRRFGRELFMLDDDTGVKSVRIIDEILGCPYGGYARRLYLEGKAFELLALRLHVLMPAADAEKRAALSKWDIQAIREAKRLLDLSLQNPPSLSRLARLAGINDFKLKLGFKQVYGTTVFGYIREERMCIARNLLERGECDVSQAAFIVGYESLSSFARRFKKTYGYNPGECKPR